MTTPKGHGALETNEGTVVGGKLQLYPDLEPPYDGGNDRFPRVYRATVQNATREGRHELLKRIFTNTGEASRQTRAEVNALFHDHDFDTHTAMLEMGKTASAEEDGDTLGARVQRAFGRF